MVSENHSNWAENEQELIEQASLEMLIEVPQVGIRFGLYLPLLKTFLHTSQQAAPKKIQYPSLFMQPWTKQIK